MCQDRVERREEVGRAGIHSASCLESGPRAVETQERSEVGSSLRHHLIAICLTWAFELGTETVARVSSCTPS